MSYFSLVYSTLDYSASTWDPHLKKNQAKLEMINCRSARFVMNAYNNNSSVTTMLNTLQWPSLETRRENQRLVLMYKIIHGLVAVPSDKLIRSQVQDHQFVDISLQEFFFSRTVPVWNSVVNSNTVELFKAHPSKLLRTALILSSGYPSLGVNRLFIQLQMQNQ